MVINTQNWEKEFMQDHLKQVCIRRDGLVVYMPKAKSVTQNDFAAHLKNMIDKVEVKDYLEYLHDIAFRCKAEVAELRKLKIKNQKRWDALNSLEYKAFNLIHLYSTEMVSRELLKALKPIVAEVAKEDGNKDTTIIY